MGRRRKEDDLAEVLVSLPWQVSAGLACLSFAVFRWIVPSLFAGNPFLIGLAVLSRSMAWLPFVVFSFVGLMAFVRARRHLVSVPTNLTRRSLHKPRIVSLAGSATSNVAAESSDGAKLDAGWGRSGKSLPSPEQAVDTFDAWSLGVLRALEWKRFELLCAKYYEAVGFKSETIHCGADGGIDVKLFRIDSAEPIAVVQCKAWNTQAVGVKEVRELLGVMTHEKVGRGVFVTTATYTKDALEFGSANSIQLLDGAAFVKKLQDLPKERQDALLKFAFEGDYKTPTCPSCGIKMVRKDGRRGPFWGCKNYPRCKTSFRMDVT